MKNKLMTSCAAMAVAMAVCGGKVMADSQVLCAGDDHHAHADHGHDHGDHGHAHGDHDDHAHGDHKGHDHGHAHVEAGPNGGRMLEKVSTPTEFFVTAERKVQITFLDDEGKVIAPTTQKVVVICGERTKPTRLEFEKVGDVLVSTEPLPEGDAVPAIVRVKTSPDTKNVTDRFTVKMGECEKCGNGAYACTCCEGHDH